MKKRFSKLTLVALLAGVALNSFAQDFSTVSVSAKEDLKAALAELAAAQREIADEKIPLAARLAEVEDEVLAKRKEVDKANREKENKLVDLNVVRSEVKACNAEVKFLGGVLNEYVNAFESRIHIAEVARYSEAVGNSRTAAGKADLAVLEKLERQLAIVDVALERVEGTLGGEAFEGRALTDAGRLESGKYVVVGPLAAFVSAESDAVGLTRLRLNTTEPSVMATTEAFKPGLKALVEAGEGALPLDPTMGNADKIAATKESFVEHISKGGPVVVPILVLGVLAVVIGVFKWVQIAGVRLARPRDLQIVLDRLKDGNEEGAMNHAGSIKGPVGELLQAAVLHSKEKKEYIEEALYEKMLNAKPRLERWMPFVALAAATAGSDRLAGAPARPAGHGHRHDQHLPPDQRLWHGRSQDALVRHFRGPGHDGVWTDRGDSRLADSRVHLPQGQGRARQHGANDRRLHQRRSRRHRQ